MKPLLLLLALNLAAAPAAAHEYFLGEIQIIHPSIPATPAEAVSAPVYMALANDGTEDDRLLAIETDLGAVVLQRPVAGPGGEIRMERVAAIEIPAGEVTLLGREEARGLIVGLTRPLAEGGSASGTLIFEKGGRFEMTFLVDPLEALEEPPAAAEASSPPQTDRAAEIRAATEALRRELGDPEGLSLGPVALQGEAAVIGWTRREAEKETAARAFLRRDAQSGWGVELWSGASLTLPATLASLGLGRQAAESLRAEVEALEAALGAEASARFDAFPGTVFVDKAQAE